MEDFAFLSPFSWRYGSREMREIFSEIRRRKLWRRIWLALAEAQAKHGLVSPEELQELSSKVEEVDLKRAQEVESQIGHDLVAELRVYAEQCPRGGGKLHMGATSMDIEDNADIIRFREALRLIKQRLAELLSILAQQIERYATLPCMGYTHLQPAEPTTLGYRLSNYAQDLLLDLRLIRFVEREFLLGKGIKGAVGSSAAFRELTGDPAGLEREVMEKLGIEAFPIASQTYPRKLDFILLCSLASLAQSLYRLASDFRHLQMLGEVMEPVGEKQVGSSAMPFKRNPTGCERTCSLCRYVSALPQVAWENASQSILERTLDDSANRRIILPEAFLAVDECLILLRKIVSGLVVNENKISENLRRWGPFAMLERVLLALVKKGHNRQGMHERLRQISMRAWKEVDQGKENPLLELLKSDEVVGKLEGLDELMKIETYLGDAPQRCLQWVRNTLRPKLKE